MNRIKDFFNLLSYLQYPLVGVSLVYYGLFMLSLVEGAINWGLLNYTLLFYGIAISFSTLQDTRKTQNKLSEKVWKSPRRGKIFLALVSLLTFGFIAGGLFGVLYSRQPIHQELALGLTVLGIGLIGLLKAAVEMFEHHRIDKNPLKKAD